MGSGIRQFCNRDWARLAPREQNGVGSASGRRVRQFCGELGVVPVEVDRPSVPQRRMQPAVIDSHRLGEGLPDIPGDEPAEGRHCDEIPHHQVGDHRRTSDRPANHEERNAERNPSHEGTGHGHRLEVSDAPQSSEGPVIDPDCGIPCLGWWGLNHDWGKEHAPSS